MTNQKKGDHTFSIEMGSKRSLSHVSLSDESEGVLIKGELGKLQKIIHEEGLMVKIIGDLGVLRIDLTEEELGKMKREVKK
jgi:hypothetical protein